MAYVAPGVTTNLKKLFKIQFPEIKLSVTRVHYSTIKVVIKAAPYNWPQGKTFVPWWYVENKLDNQQILEKIYDEMNTGNHDNSDSMTDYFDVGWYTNLSFDKNFINTNHSVL